MREILFRALTENVNGLPNYNAYWVYGLLENSGVKEYPYMIAGCFVDPETVGQFTGLTDKKGVKIFEGDILVDKEGSILVVKFGQFKAGKDDYDIEYMPLGFHILFSDDGTYCINLDGDGYAISAKECSIVGNINENPELLK